MGYHPAHEESCTNALNGIKDKLKLLENHFKSHKNLIGDQLTVADIALAVRINALYTYALGEKIRKSYPVLLNWFTVITESPHWKNVPSFIYNSILVEPDFVKQPLPYLNMLNKNKNNLKRRKRLLNQLLLPKRNNNSQSKRNQSRRSQRLKNQRKKMMMMSSPRRRSMPLTYCQHLLSTSMTSRELSSLRRIWPRIWKTCSNKSMLKDGHYGSWNTTRLRTKESNWSKPATWTRSHWFKRSTPISRNTLSPSKVCMDKNQIWKSWEHGCGEE